jgi:hypothetical protein
MSGCPLLGSSTGSGRSTSVLFEFTSRTMTSAISLIDTSCGFADVHRVVGGRGHQPQDAGDQIR